MRGHLTATAWALGRLAAVHSATSAPGGVIAAGQRPAPPDCDVQDDSDADRVESDVGDPLIGARPRPVASAGVGLQHEFQRRAEHDDGGERRAALQYGSSEVLQLA
jgi:hypothetical protein